MRVLVTGASGFIGPHVVRRLAEEGHGVLSLSRAEAGPDAVARHFQLDVGSDQPWPKVDVDAVIHLAAASSVIQAQEDPAGVTRANIQGTMHALLFARERGARFVFASSQRTYRMGAGALEERAEQAPPDLYGYTKVCGEALTRMAGRVWGLPAAIVRPFAVYGPGQLVTRGISGVVSIFAQRALADQPLTVMSRHAKDFVEVSDVAEGIAGALNACQTEPPAYNIATGVPITVLELAEKIKAATGSNSSILEDYSHDEPGALVADIGKARRELGYEPRVGLDEGLKTYVHWLQSR